MKDEDLTAKAAAVARMIEMLKSKEATEAMVALLQYFIEGESYSATALTLSDDFTINIAETENGFRCEAFFPDEMLTPHGQAAGVRIENGLKRVKLEVRLEDIIAIGVATESGPQTMLYTLPEDEE
jgi:hypothetical protein